MRVRLQANIAGEMRLTYQEEKRRSQWREDPSAIPLVLSSKLQDCIYTGHFATKAGHGWQPDGKRFTSLARRRLREAGAIVDNGPREEIIFLTGTLPGSSIGAMAALARFSGWLISRLSQWFRDTFDDPQYFGVWEYQKRGALHLHVCIRLKTAEEARSLKQRWKTRWIKLLDKLSALSSCDVFEKGNGGSWQEQRWKTRTDAQVVEQSVSRYLSKYLGKKSCKRRLKSCFPPSTWWFMSQNLREHAQRQQVDYQVENLPDATARSLFECLAGEVASAATLAYPIENRWDKKYQSVLLFMPGPIAGACLRQILPLLECLDGNRTNQQAIERPTLAEIRRMMHGHLLTFQ